MRGNIIPLGIIVNFKLICPSSCMPAWIYKGTFESLGTYPQNSMFMLKPW